MLCVSPLIAIMIEQSAKFTALGVNAQFVGEAQTDATVRQCIIDGQFQLVFISPENLLCNSQYRGMLCLSQYKTKLVAIVVDEADCVKVW